MQMICINVGMQKRNFLIWVSIAGSLGLIGLLYIFLMPKLIVPKAEKISVIVTLYPWQYLAEQIGGEYASVQNIVPVGAEPHDFSPLPQDIAAVYRSDIFIMNGGGIEPWAETLTAADYTASNHQTLTMLSETNTALAGDPHIWLDPIIVKAEVATIRDAYIQLDPKHTSTYFANAEKVSADLTALNQKYSTQLNNCALNTIIVSHDAFAYLGQRYDITVLPILGINPNSTPSARALSDLSIAAQAQSIDYIFFETLTSPELAQTLANEVGAKTLVLNPLEGLTLEQKQSGADYISLMSENLANLQTALHCPAQKY
ncbi:MAG: hypothetical protein ACD_43C00234G0005 [uncultured bacterium]|nr:MAG: hypothetical protein ACD_43C00234G0005 [uncultured bacterium]